MKKNRHINDRAFMPMEGALLFDGDFKEIENKYLHDHKIHFERINSNTGITFSEIARLIDESWIDTYSGVDDIEHESFSESILRFNMPDIQGWVLKNEKTIVSVMLYYKYQYIYEDSIVSFYLITGAAINPEWKGLGLFKYLYSKAILDLLYLEKNNNSYLIGVWCDPRIKSPGSVYNTMKRRRIPMADQMLCTKVLCPSNLYHSNNINIFEGVGIYFVNMLVKCISYFRLNRKNPIGFSLCDHSDIDAVYDFLNSLDVKDYGLIIDEDFYRKYISDSENDMPGKCFLFRCKGKVIGIIYGHINSIFHGLRSFMIDGLYFDLKFKKHLPKALIEFENNMKQQQSCVSVSCISTVTNVNLFYLGYLPITKCIFYALEVKDNKVRYVNNLSQKLTIPFR